MDKRFFEIDARKLISLLDDALNDIKHPGIRTQLIKLHEQTNKILEHLNNHEYTRICDGKLLELFNKTRQFDKIVQDLEFKVIPSLLTRTLEPVEIVHLERILTTYHSLIQEILNKMNYS